MVLNARKIFSVLSNNHFEIEASRAEEKLRSESEQLLLPTEVIEVAFKSRGEGGRDKAFFTSVRVLIQDGKGLGRKRKHYKSIPYSGIRAFSVQTAGASSLDTDTELRIWHEGDGNEGPFQLDFCRRGVDLFRIQQYFNAKVFGGAEGAAEGAGAVEGAEAKAKAKAAEEESTPSSTLLSWIADDAVSIDPVEAGQRFGSKADRASGWPVLVEGEAVEAAYRARRDMVLLTSLRLLVVDAKGLSGSRVEFLSVKWSCVRAFSVETSGSWDLNSDFVVHTNISSLRKIKQDLRKTKTDVLAVQMSFCDKLLGGTGSTCGSGSSANPPPTVDRREGHFDPGPSLFGGGNNRPLDAALVEQNYKTHPKLLQDDESVELAFVGRRDLVLFTNKRILDIDTKGWTGKKVEYTSIPYSSILAYAVQTAGKHDRDAEVVIYTDMRYECEGEEPDPGMSCLEWDFNKNLVDVLHLKRYLNRRLLFLAGRPTRASLAWFASDNASVHASVNASVNANARAAPEERGMEKLLSKWGGDQRTIDAGEVNRSLHDDLGLLLDDETVAMAFRAGRDVSCFTNRRVLIIDTKGWSGRKIEYLSIPYGSVGAFSAESASTSGWDRDGSVNLYTKNHWTLSKVKLDFRKGKADIFAIQTFLSAMVLGGSGTVSGGDTASAPNACGGCNGDASYYCSHGPNASNEPRPVQAAAAAAAATATATNHSDAAGVGFLTDWIVDMAVEEDPSLANTRLHGNPAPVLLGSESVEKAYREGRDLWVYTNLRLLRIDAKGLSGTRVKYQSIPLQALAATEGASAIRAFAVETVGHIDIDAECFVHTNLPSIGRIVQRVLVKRGNIMDLHEYLGSRLLVP